MTRDQFLTKKVLGECWHEWEEYLCTDPLSRTYHLKRLKCKKCGIDSGYGSRSSKVNNFSKEKGFFKLWNFCKEQEWWESFVFEIIKFGTADHTVHDCMINLINPDTFANAVARYRGWEGK